MNKTMKPVALLACSLVLLCLDSAPGTSLKIQFLRDAQAIIGIAPGGSVVRRHAIVGTAAVASTTAQATASANASAAAAAEANAAAANANAAAAAAAATPAPAPAGPPAVGTIVTTLPPGCVAETLNNVAYQLCGVTYYTTAMMGNNLVFVVAQP